MADDAIELELNDEIREMLAGALASGRSPMVS